MDLRMTHALARAIAIAALVGIAGARGSALAQAAAKESPRPRPRLRRLALPRLPPAGQGTARAGKHKTVGCNACHDGTAAHLGDPSKRPATKTDLATCGGCHQNQYKSYAQMDWARTARFEKKQYCGPAPDPVVRPADVAARLHQGAQPPALAHLRAARPVRRRPRVRRPLRDEGRLALSRRLWRFQRDGRRRRPVPRQHRSESVQARHRRGGESRVPVVQDAGPHPRLGVHGRPGAGRQMEPHVEGRRARQGFEPRAQLHLLPRPARGEAENRPRRADRSRHADRFPDAVLAGRAQDQGRRQGHGRARLHAQDRPARTLRRQAPVRRNATSNTTATRASIRIPAKRSRWPTSGPTTSRSSTSTTSSRPTITSSSATSRTSSPAPRCGRRSTRMSRPTTTRSTKKLGIDCASCHMPKVKDAKTGKLYTSHWQTNPKHYLKETCLQCHSQWNEQQAKYVIESMDSHYQGKVRNAEFWLSQLINRFGQAQLVGVGEDVLKAARAKHGDAHANWEWWTAANGASFHNPELRTDRSRTPSPRRRRESRSSTTRSRRRPASWPQHQPQRPQRRRRLHLRPSRRRPLISDKGEARASPFPSQGRDNSAWTPRSPNLSCSGALPWR